jgi:hypothetical protein
MLSVTSSAFSMFALRLIAFFSYNQRKQFQNNTVFPTQIKMDRVGFEPTTLGIPPDPSLRNLRSRSAVCGNIAEI